MVRFSAPPEEIAALLRFAARRLPNGMRLVPLSASNRDDLRFRRTSRPLLRALERSNASLLWGICSSTEDETPLAKQYATDSEQIQVDPEASRLIVLWLGPAEGPERRREGLLEVRDWLNAAGDALLPESEAARDLVERCARRLRRRGVYENGRWRQ